MLFRSEQKAQQHAQEIEAVCWSPHSKISSTDYEKLMNAKTNELCHMLMKKYLRTQFPPKTGFPIIGGGIPGDSPIYSESGGQNVINENLQPNIFNNNVYNIFGNNIIPGNIYGNIMNVGVNVGDDGNIKNSNMVDNNIKPIKQTNKISQRENEGEEDQVDMLQINQIYMNPMQGKAMNLPQGNSPPVKRIAIKKENGNQYSGAYAGYQQQANSYTVQQNYGFTPINSMAFPNDTMNFGFQDGMNEPGFEFQHEENQNFNDNENNEFVLSNITNNIS